MASCGKPSPFQHVDADFRFVFCASSSGCALDCEQENAYVSVLGAHARSAGHLWMCNPSLPKDCPHAYKVSPMLPPTDANAPIPHGADRESPVFSKASVPEG
eukprot:scaffold217986_cov18-Tisochrysis_lutea.AAC.1